MRMAVGSDCDNMLAATIAIQQYIVGGARLNILQLHMLHICCARYDMLMCWSTYGC